MSYRIIKKDFNSSELKCIQCQLELLQEKLKNNQNKFREQFISVGDVIVFSSGRRLRLESIRFGDKQTLILINLKTGSVYRRKFKTESFPESEYDVVIHYKSLCYQLWQILEVFGLSEDKINSIEAYSN